MKVDHDQKHQIAMLLCEKARYMHIEANICDKELQVQALGANLNACQQERLEIGTWSHNCVQAQ